MKPAAMKAGFFHAGKAAHDANDRIVYDKKTGALFYDADGTGKMAQVKFATLTNKPVLKATDFFVI
ncbi:calcium-binding protein [Microvirga ossetica]|nr:calcium-binding protein [Microvirga ossetica]